MQTQSSVDPIVARMLTGGVNIQSWPNLNLTPTLIDGGGADTGGPNSFAHGRTDWSPGHPGIITTHPVARPKGQPWDNSYNYGTLSRDKLLDLSVFMHQWSFMYPTQADIDVDTADEFEVEKCEAGVLYNCAWQYKPSASLADGPAAWRAFDRHNGKWDAVPGLPTPKPVPGKWVRVQALFVLDRHAGLVWHDSINIDGTWYYVGMSHGVLTKWSPSTWYVHHAFQPDSNGKGSGRKIMIDDWAVKSV